ncbi:MAG: hypothetical protein Q8K85_12455, partial [Hyphomicrobium sp.]|nr:hypothetical protein [Hyphomicrobium sp.]
ASLTGRVLTLSVHRVGKPRWHAPGAATSLAPVGTSRTIGGYMMVVDQCVRLGMALVIIALVSLALYQFSGRGRVNAQEINQVIAPTSGVAASIARN